MEAVLDRQRKPQKPREKSSAICQFMEAEFPFMKERQWCLQELCGAKVCIIESTFKVVIILIILEWMH